MLISKCKVIQNSYKDIFKIRDQKKLDVVRFLSNKIYLSRFRKFAYSL